MYTVMVLVTIIIILIIIHIGYIIKFIECLGNNRREKFTQNNYKKFLTETVKEKDDKIHYLYYYDGLTKLPNKACFMESLKEPSFIETKDELVALFFINVDNLVNINITLGHDYGDKVIQLISEVMKILIPKNSVLYKWYGDEFLLMIKGIENKDELAPIADKITKHFSKPFEIGENQIYITISIGISTYPSESCSIEEGIRNSEIAMYKSKEIGINKYSFYTVELHKIIMRENDIRRNLGNAIYNEELSLNYQPQYEISTGKIIGYEALLRWNNKELGQVPPNEFIPISEQNGLILALGNWVLKTACMQNSKWLSKGFCNVIAVNISPVQFEQDNFIEIVQEVLHETGLPAEYLELEITETAVIKSIERSVNTIDKLSKLGVTISLDDFGTGYSSLNYLKKLPLNKLKIDKVFIDDLGISIDSKLILGTIVQLAHTLKLKVIAEGIETIEQKEILKQIDCDIAQGYYYCKPTTSVGIESILDKSLVN